MSRQGTAKAKEERDATAEEDALKAMLLDSGVEEEDVDLGGGRVVRVRGLTRDESVLVSGHDKDGDVGYEAKTLELGMIRPKLTYKEARKWQTNAPAWDIQVVTEAIQRLSGMKEESRKEAIKSALE